MQLCELTVRFAGTCHSAPSWSGGKHITGTHSLRRCCRHAICTAHLTHPKLRVGCFNMGGGRQLWLGRGGGEEEEEERVRSSRRRRKREKRVPAHFKTVAGHCAVQQPLRRRRRPSSLLPRPRPKVMLDTRAITTSTPAASGGKAGTARTPPAPGHRRRHRRRRRWTVQQQQQQICRICRARMGPVAGPQAAGPAAGPAGETPPPCCT